MINYSTAHQPAFLPWLGLIQKIYFSKKFILMDMANFRKRSYMHRNLIEINNSEFFIGLSIPKKFDETPCNQILYGENFIKKDLEKIYEKISYQYKKDKFFCETENFFNKILNRKPKSFIDLIKIQNEIIFKNLNAKTKFYTESEIFNKDEYRKMNVNEKLLKHATFLNEKNYLSGVNSVKYLDLEIFKKKQINNFIQKFDYSYLLKFQKTSKPLSLIHQISKLGFDGIYDYLNTKNINFEKYCD